MVVPDNATPEAKAFIESVDLDSINSQIPGQVFIKDRNGVYIYATDHASPEGALETPQTPDEIVGKTDDELPWKIDSHEFQDHDKRVLDNGETIVFEDFVHLEGQPERRIACVKAPFRDAGGNVIGVIGNAVEITQVAH